MIPECVKLAGGCALRRLVQNLQQDRDLDREQVEIEMWEKIHFRAQRSGDEMSYGEPGSLAIFG